MRPSLRSFLPSLTRATLALALLAGTVAAVLASAAAAPLVLVAAPASSEHRAYLVKITGKGDYADDDATMLAVVDTALQRWVVESEHAISDFTRVGGFVDLATETDCQDPGELWDEAAALYPQVDFSGDSANHLIVLGPAACTKGHGTVGSGLASGGLVTVRYNPDSSPQTLLHELGHNLGLHHAHALRCEPDCADVEYGNDYSFMGYTTAHDPAYVPSSLDSFQRQQLGVDEHCEIRDARLPDGVPAGQARYVLAPRGTDEGPRGVQITDPRTGSVSYLDFRNGAGRDAGAYYVGSTKYREGVTVEKTMTDADGDRVTQLQGFPPTAASGPVYSLRAGQAWTDGGVRVTVDRLGPPNDATATATVTVTLTGADAVGAAPAPLVDGCESEAPEPGASAVPTLPTSPPSTVATPTPSTAPSTAPSAAPSAAPPVEPPVAPTPTTAPLAPPTTLPSGLPTQLLTVLPTVLPTGVVTPLLDGLTTSLPTALPTSLPSVLPGVLPDVLPGAVTTTPAPTLVPSTLPTATSTPTGAPTSALPTPALPTAPVASSPGGSAIPGSDIGAPPVAHHPDDTVQHQVPAPPDGLLPPTGSPRFLLAEIAAAAFLLGFGAVLVAAARQRPKDGSRPMKPISLV